jgi:uncharacterized membrane protein YwzB
MTIEAALPIVATVLGIIISFYKLQSIHEESEKKNQEEMKKYVDKELQFIREIYNNQITVLNAKIDRLIDMVEKMRDKE